MATISEEEPLTFEQAAECRAKAEQVLSHLQGDASSPSWVRGAAAAHRHHHDHPNNNTISTSQQAQYFDTHGFLVNKNFANSEMVKSLKEQMATLVDEHWDPFAQDGKEEIDTFGTDAAANTARGDYFLDSSNRVHYFAEQKALDQKNFNNKQLQLKEEFVVAKEDKLSILNKAGHGMHNNPGAFRDYTLSDKMRNLVLDLGWKDPVVPQSMYIFKQAKIGGTVHSHQDSTFLFTTPRQTCLGLWLALDDATLENGCLWVRPGSHKEPLRRQFIRNPEYFEKGNTESPKLTFRQHDDNANVTWEGSLPQTSLLEEGFIPIEVKAGDLVTFCGTLDHLSLPNFSNLPRHTFQLHLVEGPKEGIAWSPSNWLQYPPGEPFLRLVHDNDSAAQKPSGGVCDSK